MTITMRSALSFSMDKVGDFNKGNQIPTFHSEATITPYYWGQYEWKKMIYVD